MRLRKGFTLVELLVVITIIVLLLALLSVLIKGVVEKARNTKTHALILLLDKGCSKYKTELGVYPPMTGFSDSSCLHFYLGRELQIPTGRDKDGNVTGYKKLPPVIQFKADMLSLPPGQDNLDPSKGAVPVMDAWAKVVRYMPYPGKNNTTGVDIWSLGKEDADSEDDITNWRKEF